MPILDWVCRTCGEEKHDVYSPLYTLVEPRVEHGYTVRQDFDKPTCCGETMESAPPRVTVDALEPMQEFDVTVEDGKGGHRVEHIDSLTKLRRVERESAQRHANGEGRPMVWRDYSQDASNKDQHTLGDPSQPTVTPAMAKKYAPKPITADEAAKAGYGAGVSDATTSALGS